MFAHNGVIEGLDRIEAALGPQRATVEGETDSERFFALINQHAERLGDLDAGIVSAARWLAEHVPLFALNMVLITSARLWAFRYPETHPLYVLERRAGGVHGDRHLEHASSAGRVRVRAGELRETPCVVAATEPMDEDHGWRLLRPGELLRVDPDLAVSARVVLPEPPVYRLSLSDLEPHAAASQSVDPSRRASEAPS